MAFFQNSVLNKHLNGQDAEAVKAAYQKFTAYFHNPAIQQNIRDAKEEQFQEGFLRELFVDILGYTLNPQPNFNLTTELKNEKGAKKADGAILSREHDAPLSIPKALAVIELKGTDTKDLDKINVQAFNYKNNQTGCVYVITSNFEKLRFFIHHSVEHLEFNLFTLSEHEFKVLWLCLHANNLLNGVPLKVKEESLIKDEQITKQLYKDYASFRNDLWQNMVKNNTQFDKLLLFKETQKLLDRFLFIFFAEDSGLLPPNSISRIVNRFEILKREDAYKPLYEIFQQYFGYINKGRKGQKTVDDIFAYNGGLFLPDNVLDNIVLDDDILHTHVMKLTNYDFQSEVDVNILGHIFENSLNEIENITAELEGQEIDKSKSKRKKDGVFYTPKYITKYIVDNTIGKLCEEKKAELSIIDEEYAKGRRNRKKDIIKSLDENLQAYRNWLLNITICDPACGSGAFLNQALEFLIEEHAYIDELQAQLFGAAIVFQDVSNHILEKNIFGVDINNESVDIAKLSLWLRTAQRGRKLTTLNNNIKCGNSLIDDPSVAGEKAFNWQKEFPTVFLEKEKKAFHITTATHDSRTSQRMVDYKVRELRDNGLNPKAQPIWLEPEDEMLITNTIYEIIKEDELNVMAYNICGDHIHLLLVCEEEEVSKIMQKIKAKTAREVNIAKGATISTTREHTQYLTREHAPLSEENGVPLSKDDDAPLPNKKRGEKQNSLWTQKFGCKEITDEKQLWNTVEYIQNNRIKHELPPLYNNKGACSLVDIEKKELFYCSYEHAFRTEYKGGFDAVIGNPPYVLCQPSNTKNELLEHYKCFEVASYKIDLFHLFFERSIQILNEFGKLGFITPNTYLTNKYIKPLREFILNKTDIISLVVHEESVFADASVDVATIILSNTKSKKNKIELLSSRNNFIYPFGNKPQENWELDADKIFNVKEDFIIDLSNCVALGEICNSYFGIQAYDRKSSISETKEDENFIEVIDGGDIFPYSYAIPNKYFNYKDENIKSGGDWKVYEQERIVIRQIGQIPIVGMSKAKILASNTLYSIYPKNSDYQLHYLLCILNSRIIKKYWLSKYSDSKQLFPKIKGYQLKELPIKIASKAQQEKFSELAKVIIELKSQLQKQNTFFIDFVKNKHQNVQSKFQNWYELEFAAFLKELKKAKVQLGLSEEAEWMQYFNEQKQKAQELKAEIEKTDKEIDKMVYELYGLSEEEIKIVEGEI